MCKSKGERRGVGTPFQAQPGMWPAVTQLPGPMVEVREEVGCWVRVSWSLDGAQQDRRGASSQGLAEATACGCLAGVRVSVVGVIHRDPMLIQHHQHKS